MKSPSLYLNSVLLACGLSLPASAVIVAGASGGGNTSNNTSAAQYFSETGTDISSVYENVVEVGGGSGSYLGYDPSTKEVWVLTARHLNMGAATSVTIDGLSYDLQSHAVAGGDARVAKYKRADNQVPGLAPLTLSNTIPTASTSLVMVGYGKNRVENATTNKEVKDSVSTGAGTGYHWDTSRIKRWGTNNVEDLGGGSTLSSVIVAGASTMTFRADFDEPAGAGGNPNDGQWLASNEAQGSTGDSGGAAFVNDGGEWKLAGIMSGIGTFVGQDDDGNGNVFSSAFGNLTYITDVSTYKSAIDSSIGVTLIPEPGTTSFLGILGVLFAWSRRR